MNSKSLPHTLDSNRTTHSSTVLVQSLVKWHDLRQLWAYAKHAEVTVPSLDDWEKDWQEKPQRGVQTELVPVNSRLPLATVAQSN